MLENSLKTKLAIGAGKLTASAIEMLRLGSGTTLPGKVARKIHPNLLRQLGSQITEETIAVTGTNGKTTTCGLLAQFIREANKTIVHNQLGANMVPGITAALLCQSRLNGQLNAQYGVLEVDEASLRRTTMEVDIHRVLVTNLFRDQLDRYGELDQTASLIGEGITKTTLKNTGGLILNADDPLVAAFGREKPEAVYYGINTVEFVRENQGFGFDPVIQFPKEVTDCPICQAPLTYSNTVFGHLGHYQCNGCDYQRPEPKVVAEKVITAPDHSKVDLKIFNETLTVKLPLPGVYNVYNLLGAIAAAIEMEIPIQAIKTGIENFHSVFGRAERKKVSGKDVLILLIKNPVGASEVLKLVGNDPNGRLLIALNDNYADGRDVSWIWDAMFEAIQTDKTIYVSGTRASDMAVRLKYSGLKEEQLKVMPDIGMALRNAVTETAESETLYILPTYTALLELKKLV